MKTIIDLKDYTKKLTDKNTSYMIRKRPITYDELISNKTYLRAIEVGLIKERNGGLDFDWAENMTPAQEEAKKRFLVHDPLFFMQEYLEDYVKIRHPAAKILDQGLRYEIIGLAGPDPILEEITQAISLERAKNENIDTNTAYDDLIFSPFFFFKELAWNDIGFYASRAVDMELFSREQKALMNAIESAAGNPDKIAEIMERQRALEQAREKAVKERKAELLKEIWLTAKRDAQRAQRLKQFDLEIRQRLKNKIRDLIPLIIRADDDEFSEFITLLTLSIRRKRQDRNKPLLIPNNNLIFSLCTTQDGYLAPFSNLTPKGAAYKVDGRIRLTASYDENKAENIDFKELMVYTIASDLWTGRIGPLNTSDIQKRIKKSVRVRPEENKAIERILKKGEHTQCVVELRKWEKKGPKYLLGPENQEDLAQFENKEDQNQKAKGYYFSDELLETTKLKRTILKIDLWKEVEAKNKGKSYTFWMSRPPYLGVINNAFNQFIEVAIDTLYTLCDGFSFDDNASSLPWALVPFFLRLLNYANRSEWVFSYEALLGDRNYLNCPKEKYMDTTNIKRDNWRIIDKVGRNFEKAGLMKMITDHQSGIIRLQPLAKALPETNQDEARKRRAPSKIDNQHLTALIKSKRDTFNFFTSREGIEDLKALPLLFINEPKEIGKGSETFEVKCRLDKENEQVIKFTETLRRKNKI